MPNDPKNEEVLEKNKKEPVEDGPVSPGWAVLGWCFPPVGLILYLVWKNSRPTRAKVAGMGALVSVAMLVISALFAWGMGALAGHMLGA